MAAITRVRAEFHTNDDDKDRDDGINETYLLNKNQVLGQNQDWGKGIIYRDHSVNHGQAFDVNVPASDCSKISYNFRKNTNDDWNVTFKLYAHFDDGTIRKVGEGNYKLGGNSKEGTIDFQC